MKSLVSVPHKSYGIRLISDRLPNLGGELREAKMSVCPTEGYLAISLGIVNAY